MIVSFDKNTKRVLMYNVYQNMEESKSRLDETTIWIDGDLPKTESKEGYQAVFYVNEDMKSIRVEYEPTLEPEPTMDEQILSGVNSTNESQLIIMEALATQYEEGLENDLNNKEVLATIYEELLAQKEVK